MPFEKEKTCQHCGAVFVPASPSDFNRRKFCGLPCAYAEFRARSAVTMDPSRVRRNAVRRANRDRDLAREAVRRAVRSGLLVRLPCEVCQSELKVEAHHDDYAKPLEVRWRCQRHHRAADLAAGTWAGGTRLLSDVA